MGSLRGGYPRFWRDSSARGRAAEGGCDFDGGARREIARERARSQKKSISSAKEILFPIREEIFFVFQRNRFLTEKKSTWKKARREVRPKLATLSSVPSSLTDFLIKLSSSMQKNVVTHLIEAITPLALHDSNWLFSSIKNRRLSCKKKKNAFHKKKKKKKKKKS